MFKKMIVAVFIIYLKLRFINASPTIYLKEIDLEDNFNPKDTKTRSELLNRAINLIKREKGPQQAAVNNCILRNKDIENKLSCISDSIERSQHRPGPYLDIDDDYYEIYPEIFINHRGRSKNFSQDYLDIKDLLRSNKDSERKRKIIFKIVNPELQVKSSNRNDLRRFNKFVNKKILRTVSDSRSDSSDSEYSDYSKTRIHYSSDSSSEEKNSGKKESKKS
uniref:Seminal fluid protein HACP008 n=1 Tax=Heliconius melpomene TaxID=34740 RepID=D9HQ68_HELME|nr:seminal fluid protein HACP008 [Heliconius melpomene]